MTSSSTDGVDEAERVMQEILASPSDSQASSSCSELMPQNTTKIIRKRKSQRSPSTPLGAVDPEYTDEKTPISKRARKSQTESEFKQNHEVTCEVKKTLSVPQSGAQDEEEDFWRNAPDPEYQLSNMDLLSETSAPVDNDNLCGSILDLDDLYIYRDLLSEIRFLEILCIFGNETV